MNAFTAILGLCAFGVLYCFGMAIFYHGKVKGIEQCQERFRQIFNKPPPGEERE